MATKQSGKSTKSKRTQTQKTAAAKPPRRREIAAAVLFLFAIFSFIGYFTTDGIFIGFLAGFIKGLIGPGFYLIAPALILSSLILCFHRGKPVRLRVTCALITAVFLGSAWHLFFCKTQYAVSFSMLSQLWHDGRELTAGGMLCGGIAETFKYLFSAAGAAVVIICASIICVLTALNITLPALADRWRNREKRQYIPEPEPEPRRKYEPAPVRTAAEKPKPPKRKIIDIPLDSEETPEQPERQSFTQHEKPVEQPVAPIFENDEPDILDSFIQEPSDSFDTPEPEYSTVQTEDIEIGIPFMEKSSIPAAVPNDTAKTQKNKKEPEPFVPEIKDSSALDYSFPPLDLLAAGTVGSTVDGSEEVRLNSQRLEAAFASFGVSVKISNATRGPSVTRYEAELEAGVKLSKLTGLADDIALSLGTNGVRIAAMPNKMSTVGIEVPNKLISKVLLRDIIESPEFTRAQSKLTFAIGKNISGEAIVGNISKLPHMLVAGTTGSGKSVCLNSIILSILYKATPKDVQLIMIDPKMVEFRVYNSIPHLLVPVVTDIKKASGALQWAVTEMMRRYTLFSEANARDLEGYNAIAARSEDMEPMPQIVVIIDELADLMMQAAKEVEESICRVAQMGRAAGMHLIIATQSPRADVITGLMKANIPSRIALKVSSSLESRIILDAGGAADKLVGNGDMLFAPIGTTKPVRIQGTWVSDEEREEVVNYIKQSGEVSYSQDVITEIERNAAGKQGTAKDKDDSDDTSDNDEMLPQAVEVIFETGQASVSMLQRRLKLGYSRAARIVDQMEKLGVVGPFEGAKPRAILMTREQWQETNS